MGAFFVIFVDQYKAYFSVKPIGEAVGTRQEGTTLLGLKPGAEILCFNVRAVKASPEILDETSIRHDLLEMRSSCKPLR